MNDRIVRIEAPVIPNISDSTRVSAGDLLFVSGAIGFEADGTAPEDFERAVELGYLELKRALKDGGADLSDVVRMNSYIVQMDQERLGIWRRTRDRVIGTENLPASTVIGVDKLFKGALFEIDAIAAV